MTKNVFEMAKEDLWMCIFTLLIFYIGCQSSAWRAGYGHSKTRFNREAQQGSVKLSFLCQLRLHSTASVCHSSAVVSLI